MNTETAFDNEKYIIEQTSKILERVSISATTNPAAQLAMEKLTELRGCEIHITHMPTPRDEAG